MSRTEPNPNGAFQFKLDPNTGVPVYRQLIDQVTGGIAAGALVPGIQLPTVRQVAVDLAINPNTVSRAYKELEIRGVLGTQQGTGTFVADRQPNPDTFERERKLDRLIGDFVARASAGGFTVQELISGLQNVLPESEKRRK